MAALKGQIQALEEVAPAALGFLAPSHRWHTEVLACGTVSCRVAPRHRASVAGPRLLLSTPFQQARDTYLLMEREAREIRRPRGPRHSSFRAATRAAQGMKQEAGRQEGEGSEEARGQEKLGFFH